LEHTVTPNTFLRNLRKILKVNLETEGGGAYKKTAIKRRKKYLSELNYDSVYNGGVLFLEFPDFSYLSEPNNIDSYLFEHLHYFNIKSILKLLDLIKMEVIAFRRYLNKKNSSCLNYTLQVLAKVKKKEYNIGKV
jgi:hypothetical protein